MDAPPKKIVKKSQEEEQKDTIAEGLGALKAAGKLNAENPPKRDAVESKMPARTAGYAKPDIHEKIEIPVSQHFYDLHKNSNFVRKMSGSQTGSEAEGGQEAPDTSIFGGKEEVSRKELELRMKKDPKVWQAEKELGLNLTPDQRAELVRKDIPQIYGKDISRTDLSKSITGLNRKLIGMQDPKEYVRIKKEIKLLKKIGGIK